MVSVFDFTCRPSQIMGITDNYTAFCFDEACAYIVRQIRDGEKPVVRVEHKHNNEIVYSRPSDLYRRYD